MKLPEDIVIVEGARTPIGSFLGGLSAVSATELGSIAASEALRRSGLKASQVDGVVFGNVLQSSKDAVYLARHIGLNIGAPETSTGVVVNLACGSGMEAIIQCARALTLGEASVLVAGGSENMSMTPYAMRGVRQGWKMVKTDVDDVLFSALYDPSAGCSIGETVEHLARVKGIVREDADRAAVRGQKRAAEAGERGVFEEEIVAVEIKGRRKSVRVDRDETLRPDTTMEALAALPGLFASDGVVTAGNSSGLNDAAAAVVMTTAEFASSRGLQPLGRVVSWGHTGVSPKLMGLGPIQASNTALLRAGLTMEDIDLVEINDAFSVQYLAVREELGLDEERVNVNGGAVALGHPMGATGTRLVLGALYELRRRQGRFALCTLCIGGGQGISMVVERL